MNTSVILETVLEKDKQTLWNLLQKYLYELSLYYDDIIPDENGIIDTPYFHEYFTDANRRAYFIRHGNERIGFAMTNCHSNLGKEIDCAIAEFTVFPFRRGQGYAETAARMLLDTKKGLWELKYSPRNRRTAAFWQKVTSKYKPEVHSLGDVDKVLLFNTR